jgi:exodeoxyribonuclease III
MGRNSITDLINKGKHKIKFPLESPDIVCFNETKIDEVAIKNEKYNSTFSDLGYNCYWNSCKLKKGYSGVAVFTRYSPEKVTYDIGNMKHDHEGRVITLEFSDYYVVAVYVPNAGQGLKRLTYRVKEWDIAFFAYLNTLKSKKDVVVCGDLNVAHKDIDIFCTKGHNKLAGFTPEERNSFSKLLSQGYIDSFRHLYPNVIKFSYFSARFGKKNLNDNKGWRLDYFLANDTAKERVIDSEILNDYDASDHSPIKLTWKV